MKMPLTNLLLTKDGPIALRPMLYRGDLEDIEVLEGLLDTMEAGGMSSLAILNTRHSLEVLWNKAIMKIAKEGAK